MINKHQSWKHRNQAKPQPSDEAPDSEGQPDSGDENVLGWKGND